MSRRIVVPRVLGALALAACTVAPLAATSYVMVPDEALVAAAPLALVGRVVAVDRSVMVQGPAGQSLVTEYTVAVEEALKGEAPAGSLRVRVPGGMGTNGIGLKIYGAPRFRQGERALMFLEPDGRGGYRFVHFFLGAFHEVPAGERSLAVRNLQEASEMRVTAAGLEEVGKGDRGPLRDFTAFARWIKARAAGAAAPAYEVADPDGSLRQMSGKFTLFEDPDGANLRWFAFDTGGNVSWRALSTGETGLSGGGYSEFQTALAAWNAETQTPIDYRYGGTTASTNGLDTYDQVNSIVFNDPTNTLPAFSCSSGGVLAQGGPWYESATMVFQGQSYHRIVNADIVINSGLSCFFSSSPNASRAAQELFGHELGHTLGLGHSCGDSDGPDPSCSNATFSDALMRAYIHDDSRGAHLNSDDQTGIRSLYRQGSGGGTPAAPTGLAATTSSTSVVHLTWNDNASNETEYRIEVKVLGGTFADIGSVPANSTAADVSGLTPSTGYVFRVRAHNASGYSDYSNEASAATNGVIGPCVADGQNLCLNNDRFRVHVDWRIASGDTGAGQVVPVTSDDSGLLWFFDANNWEMLVKVLNGCTLSPPRYWVFFAATTNVQYTVTVTDTQTGAVKVYFNPLNNSAAAVTDTSAFATCP
jgi:fibronectin type III domain protein